MAMKHVSELSMVATDSANTASSANAVTEILATLLITRFRPAELDVGALR